MDGARTSIYRGQDPRLRRLAEQVRQCLHRDPADTPRHATGWPGLDVALGGGFAAAGVHELVGPLAGSAIWTVALRTATRAAGSGRWIIAVDPTQTLYPPGLQQLGVPLDRLLVVHASRSADILWIGEQALRCAAIATVVLPVRRMDAYAARRLQLAAEAGGGLGLLLRTTADPAARFVASRVEIAPVVVGGGRRCVWATVTRTRDGAAHQPVIIDLDDPGEKEEARPPHRGIRAS